MNAGYPRLDTTRAIERFTSRIWDGDWRKERAGAYGVDPGEELEEFYRKRSMLKRNVLPEDIAEAVYFLASDMSAYVTGHNIPVDGGTKTGGGWFWSPSIRRFTNRPTTL